jgi:hypothetical protein
MDPLNSLGLIGPVQNNFCPACAYEFLPPAAYLPFIRR